MKKIFVVAAVLIGSRLQAQTQDSISKTMDEVVITANKFPQKESGTGKVVTVITKEQIMQSGGKDLSQLLNEQEAGVIVNSATSNPGKDKSLFVRECYECLYFVVTGWSASQRSYRRWWYVRSSSSFTREVLNVQEILKGSQSTLYGSNAVAGVINIISKKPATTKPVFNGLLTYGSYNSFKGNANISQKIKWFEYDLNYVYNTTDGISEAKDTTGNTNFDKDGFKQHAIQVVTGINFTV